MKTFLVELTVDVDDDWDETFTEQKVENLFADFEPAPGVVVSVANVYEQ